MWRNIPFSKSVNFILTWTLSFLNIIKPLKWLYLVRGSLLSFTVAENSQSKWITLVFNKNVNVYLRCEQRALHFNNETIKSVGAEIECVALPPVIERKKGGREEGRKGKGGEGREGREGNVGEEKRREGRERRQGKVRQRGVKRY